MSQAHVDDDGTKVRVRLRGALDVYAAARLKEALEAVPARDSVLDLGEVERMDTAGVQLVHWHVATVRGRGQGCVVRHGEVSRAAAAALGLSWEEGT